MSKHSRIAGKDPASAAPRAHAPEFDPVPVRQRHDGWHAEKQAEFIEALAECGCVEHACQRVGMSVRSAYALRLRADAQSFRIAWDVALEYAVQRLSDAVLSRAIHGVARPVFFQGQQIGERRYFDERLAMFILRYRDPPRYGRWIDRMEADRQPDAAAIRLTHELNHVLEEAMARAFGEQPPPRRSAPLSRIVPAAERERQEAEDAERHERERDRRETAAKLDALRRREFKGDVP